MIPTCQHCQKRCSWFKYIFEIAFWELAMIICLSYHPSIASRSVYSRTLLIQTRCGKPTWKISMEKYYAYHNSRYWRTRPKGTSQIFTEPWYSNSSSKLRSLQSYKRMWRLRSRHGVSMQRSWMPLRCLTKQTKYKVNFFFYAQLDLTSTSKDGRFGAMMSVNLTNEVFWMIELWRVNWLIAFFLS